jgi:RNA polymerase sigma factor (sigma-70 family)
MANGQTSEVIQHLRRTVRLPDEPEPTDEQLLEEFISRRDESAIAALVQRHGSVVWGVCRRVLGNHHDAEDAFQATFLVLVRKAASISSRNLLANWLYGVAYQIARKARTTIARKTGREKQVMEVPERAVPQHDPQNDLRELLEWELNRLPAFYRVVIVLCDLEGKTRTEAARQLGLPEGTVGSRLARARTMLARRLVRHGAAVSGAVLPVFLSQNAVSAAVPAAVLSSTIRVATLVATGNAAGAVSLHVATLAERVLKTMLLTKLKRGLLALLALLAVGVLGFGGIFSVHRLPAAEDPKEKKVPEEPKDRNDPPTKAALPETVPEAKEKLQGTWVKVSEEFGGKPVAKEDVRSAWFHFTEDKLTIYGIDLRASTPEKAECSYSLDPKANPKTIKLFDGKRLEGPRTKPPEDVEAIYKVKGDVLTLAIGKKGLPTEFKTKEGDGVLVAVFKREGRREEKPNPKK